MTARFGTLLAVLAMTTLPALVQAGSDDSGIERQIEALQARVAALEARTSFTSFMPNFAERFHVMHRAGEAADWAVAEHELSEMQRLAALSVSVDATKGKLMQAMMNPRFEALEAAIEARDHERFEQELPKMINTCNACHAASGSSFIEVTLDAKESLSLRHPHRFLERAAAAGHTHGTPAGGGGGAHSEPAGSKPHDDAGRPDHTD